jgi:X-X-X-Leu-X-X-Gly heptad repeat protein
VLLSQLAAKLSQLAAKLSQLAAKLLRRHVVAKLLPLLAVAKLLRLHVEIVERLPSLKQLHAAAEAKSFTEPKTLQRVTPDTIWLQARHWFPVA